MRFGHPTHPGQRIHRQGSQKGPFLTRGHIHHAPGLAVSGSDPGHHFVAGQPDGHPNVQGRFHGLLNFPCQGHRIAAPARPGEQVTAPRQIQISVIQGGKFHHRGVTQVNFL